MTITDEIIADPQHAADKIAQFVHDRFGDDGGVGIPALRLRLAVAISLLKEEAYLIQQLRGRIADLEAMQ